MKALDFEYDGQLLSDYGFIICNFDYGSGATEVSSGATITFSKKSHNGGKRFSKVGASYDECISASFDICKNPDINLPEGMEITKEEFADIGRWLNRREFLKFRIIENNKVDLDSQACFFNASFNISKITINETLYGIRLSMETDSPFGYGQERVHKWSLTDSETTVSLYDQSGDIGFLYPEVIIKSGIDGDITLKNEMTGCTTVVKNCSVGETITLHGDTLVITTDKTTHKIYDDFNFNYFTIGNIFENTENKITILLSKTSSTPTTPTTITIKYNPIIKDVPS